MTVKEVLQYQRESGHVCFIRQGLFFRGYNEAASVLYDYCGYQVKSGSVKACGERLCYGGFPTESIGRVIEKVTARGGRIIRQEDNYVELADITVRYDASQLEKAAMLCAPTPECKPATVSVEQRLLSFDLLTSTPLECMEFIRALQQLLR